MEIREKLEELDLMYMRAQMGQAEESLLKWLEEAEEEGDEGARLAIYNEMEGLYRTIGRAKEAVQVSEQALRLVEEMGLLGTMSHGTTLLNGATANRAAGNLKEALKLYQQAAEIFRSLGKTDGYEMAGLYNNISHIYQAQGSHEQALSYLEQALALVMAMENSGAECAVTRVGMSLSLMALGRLGEAQEMIGEALSWYESPAGRSDPHYGAALSSAGELAYRQGDRRQAIGLLERALEMTRRVYGESDDCQIIRRNLERILQER